MLNHKNSNVILCKKNLGAREIFSMFDSDLLIYVQKMSITNYIKLPEPIYKCNKNHPFLVSFIYVKNVLGVPCIQIGNLNLSGHIHLKILSKDSL